MTRLCVGLEPAGKIFERLAGKPVDDPLSQLEDQLDVRFQRKPQDDESRHFGWD